MKADKMKVDQNKREARRKNTGEVFTPSELVNEMLNKFPKKSWVDNEEFLDPACGNGNMLIEIYRWKVEKYNHSPIKALSTIYGVELMADNTAECKIRLYNMAKEYIKKEGKLTNERKKVIQKILEKNIVCHDALTYNYDFEDLNFVAKNKGKLSSLKDISGTWYTVEEVITKIKGGTAVRINSGAGVDVIKEGTKEYLRSKKNDTIEDNISQLPEENIK